MVQAIGGMMLATVGELCIAIPERASAMVIVGAPLMDQPVSELAATRVEEVLT